MRRTFFVIIPQPIKVMIALAGVIGAGCAASNPLHASDASYPKSWPAIVHLGSGCTRLDGVYANAGTFVSMSKAHGGEEHPISLTSLVLAGNRTESGNVSLRVETRRTDQNGDTISRLWISPSDGGHEPGSAARRETYCINGDLAFPNAQSSSSGIPYLYVNGWQRNLWLTKGEDGCLIVRVSEYSAGLAVVVPYYVEGGGWAKFTRTAE